MSEGRPCIAQCNTSLDLVAHMSGTNPQLGWLRTSFGLLCPACRETGHGPYYVAVGLTEVAACDCGWKGSAHSDPSLAELCEDWRAHLLEAAVAEHNALVVEAQEWVVKSIAEQVKRRASGQ